MQKQVTDFWIDADSEYPYLSDRKMKPLFPFTKKEILVKLDFYFCIEDEWSKR